MLIGEAWGKDEEPLQLPFQGKSGRMLKYQLSRAGIRYEDCYVTNVFNLRPKPTDDIKNLCGKKDEGVPGLPMLSTGKYIKAQYAPHLTRLYAEIEDVQPNLIVSLGVTPTWAVLRESVSINAYRGAVIWSKAVKRKVLPTFHPAAIFRDYTIKPIQYADLCKAHAEQEFPEIRAAEREIWTEPTLADLYDFRERYIDGSPDLSIDIETKGGQMTCIGFAPDPFHALVVPFHDAENTSGNYWGSLEEEVKAVDFVREVCRLPKRVLFQNGMFDMQFLWKVYGIPVPGAADDTMLLHHALQPEMKKSLGFLATIYTGEPGWKFMHRSTKKEDTE